MLSGFLSIPESVEVLSLVKEDSTAIFLPLWRESNDTEKSMTVLDGGLIIRRLQKLKAIIYVFTKCLGVLSGIKDHFYNSFFINMFFDKTNMGLI